MHFAGERENWKITVSTLMLWLLTGVGDHLPAREPHTLLPTVPNIKQKTSL